MSTISSAKQLVDELYKIDGKAEIVGGRIVMMSPTGDMPSSAGGAIYACLQQYAKQRGGRAYPDNVAYLVELPHRKSFSPDASYYTGPRAQMKFLPQAPVFAVEVRSEGDYGPAAEEQLAAKRADYFAAGTKVVWDVDLLGEDVIRVYRSEKPEQSHIYRKGELAEAEPAVPGWSLSVEELFE
ncbi:MAG: Uma2 family endonuclease [Planctomycetes bacterium]|nr:Uma2 family endonuclease [Planctomycetota bacterium]